MQNDISTSSQRSINDSHRQIYKESMLNYIKQSDQKEIEDRLKSVFKLSLSERIFEYLKVLGEITKKDTVYGKSLSIIKSALEEWVKNNQNLIKINEEVKYSLEEATKKIVKMTDERKVLY